MILIFISALLPLIDIIDDGNFNFIIHLNFKNISMYAEYFLSSLCFLLLLGYIDYNYIYVFINYFKVFVIYLFCYHFFFIKLIINFKQKFSYIINYFRQILFLQTSQAILPFV